MKKLVLFLLVAVAAFAANSVMTKTIPVVSQPPLPEEFEFYWDDGIMAAAWAWYTGGNYWAVQFDSVKTGGADGYVTNYGAQTHPTWPDGTFQGAYMHTFEDLGGYPGSSLDFKHLQFTAGGVFQWVAPDSPVLVTGGVFYIAFEQIGNYPNCDGMGVDAVAGTHNWTGYQGSWAPTTAHGDYMIRCYWDGDPGVEPTSWGAVKALY